MDGPGVGTTFELTQVNVIGRGAKCNIRLQSDSIEEKQAVIQCKSNAYFINSNTPEVVQVNGHPVYQERKLIHGDMVTIADVMLLYGEEGGDAASDANISSAPVVGDEKTPTIKSRQKFYKDTEAAIKSIAQSKQSAHSMEVLLKVSNAIMSKLELKELLQQLLDILFENLPADRGTIFLRDPKADKLWPMASKKREEIGRAHV